MGVKRVRSLGVDFIAAGGKRVNARWWCHRRTWCKSVLDFYFVWLVFPFFMLPKRMNDRCEAQLAAHRSEIYPVVDFGYRSRHTRCSKGMQGKDMIQGGHRRVKVACCLLDKVLSCAHWLSRSVVIVV